MRRPSTATPVHIPLYKAESFEGSVGEKVSRTRVGVLAGQVLIDEADAEWLQRHTWRLTPGGYACRWERRQGRTVAIAMHRAILGLAADDPLWGDHINGDRLDNRRQNLRAVTPAENRANSRACGKSGFKGVYWHEAAKKWEAKVSLGLFDTPEQAAAAVEELRARA